MIDLLRATLARGAATGDFRADVDALDFYVTLASMAYYLVSNRFTLKVFVGLDYTESTVIAAVTEMQVKMLIAYLQPTSPGASP